MGRRVLRGPTRWTERKRFIVISPNRWNAIGGYAAGVRTTTQFKGRPLQFPQVLRYPKEPAAFACCGDATTFASNAFDQRERPPRPTQASLQDMVAIAKGLLVTHELARLSSGIPFPSLRASGHAAAALRDAARCTSLVMRRQAPRARAITQHRSGVPGPICHIRGIDLRDRGGS